MRSTNVPLSFALLGRFTFALIDVFRTGAMPQIPFGRDWEKPLPVSTLPTKEHLEEVESREASGEALAKPFCQPSELAGTRETPIPLMQTHLALYSSEAVAKPRSSGGIVDAALPELHLFPRKR